MSVLYKIYAVVNYYASGWLSSYPSSDPLRLFRKDRRAILVPTSWRVLESPSDNDLTVDNLHPAPSVDTFPTITLAHRSLAVWDATEDRTRVARVKGRGGRRIFPLDDGGVGCRPGARFS